MRLAHRISLLIFIIIIFSTAANFFLTQYQEQNLHHHSEKILARTLIQSLRDALVRDIIDGNKLRITNLLRTLKDHNNPIVFLYVTQGDKHRVFAHSFLRKNIPELQLLASAFENAARERQQAVESLKEREKNLDITLNSIGDAVITTDALGNITRMNPVASQLTGWSNEKACGQSVKSIFPIIDATTRESIENPVEKVLSTGQTIYLSNHTTLISRSGVEYQIADSSAPIRNKAGEIMGMVLVFNDVTEQYQLRELAARSKRDMQAIMDHSPSVIYVKDTQGRFTFINQKFEELFHITREEIAGKTDFDLFPKAFAEEFAKNDQKVLNSST